MDLEAREPDTSGGAMHQLALLYQAGDSPKAREKRPHRTDDGSALATNLSELAHDRMTVRFQRPPEVRMVAMQLNHA
jgi:hypothetical protein